MTPSFQLSFAATLALIAAYHYGLSLPHAGTASGWRARLALWGWREVATIAFTSVVAGLATFPYAAYNFHRVAPYGVLANVLAMPVVSVWVMPMGILGVLPLPLGFDGVFWRLMGDGISWIIGVVLWVAHLPGAVGAISVFGTGPLPLCTAGLLLMCLLRTPLRLSGAPLMLVAAAWALTTPRPDLLVSADGQSAALRGADGRLAVLHVGRDNFAVEDWLVADGDARDAQDRSLRRGIACDPSGCIGKLADGSIVAYAVEPEAFGGRLRSRGPDPRRARRSAARLRSQGYQARDLVRPWCAGITPRWHGLRYGFRTAAEFRSAMGTGAATARRFNDRSGRKCRCSRLVTLAAARRDATSG